MSADQLEDQRLEMWKIGWTVLKKYFPFGSGFGTIVEVFQVDEPHELLSYTYTNHLHNDWLETLVAGGLFTVTLVAVTVAAWVTASRNAFRRPFDQRRGSAFGRKGSIIILILGISSFVDYPLRTPSLTCLLVIAAIWLSSVDEGDAPQGEYRRKMMDVAG
jgi:O-antigen ligase